MKIHKNPITHTNPKEHRNKAIRYKFDGQPKWIWYDFIGRDFGPYDSKGQATVLGQEASKREEKSLRAA